MLPVTLLALIAAAALAAPAAALAQFSMEDDDAGIPAPTPGGVTKLLGIHVASVSTFRDVPTGAAVFQGGFTSTNASDNTSFSVYSSWENIQRELRIPSQPQPGLPSQSQ